MATELKNKIVKLWQAHKNLLVYIACVFASFGLGYGSGAKTEEAKWHTERARMQINYTTKTAKSDPEAGDNQANPTPQTQITDKNCTVKGNISSAGKKIFHVAGGAFYNTVKPEQCFASEADARTAGFTKSQR